MDIPYSWTYSLIFFLSCSLGYFFCIQTFGNGTLRSYSLIMPLEVVLLKNGKFLFADKTGVILLIPNRNTNSHFSWNTLCLTATFVLAFESDILLLERFENISSVPNVCFFLLGFTWWLFWVQGQLRNRLFHLWYYQQSWLWMQQAGLH